MKNNTLKLCAAVLAIVSVEPSAFAQREGDRKKDKEVARFQFQAPQEDAEFTEFPELQEALIPRRRRGNEAKERAENSKLADRLNRFRDRKRSDRQEDLESYVAENPDSRWAPSVYLNIGLNAKSAGRYTKALEALSQAWTLSNDDGDLKKVADRAAGELCELNASLARIEQLEALLAEIGERKILGSANDKVIVARESLALIRLYPQLAFRCGPDGVERLLQHRGEPSDQALKIVRNTPVTTNGSSLADLSDLCKKVGLQMQMAKRAAGSTLVEGSIVHWKLGHFGTLLKVQGDRVLVYDPSEKIDRTLALQVLEEEASGYFLVPAGTLPPGWASVSKPEAAQVWGRVCPNTAMDNGRTDRCSETTGGCCKGKKRMALYDFQALVVGLTIFDFPVGYKPARGPEVEFLVKYNQREYNQPTTMTFSHLGPKWTCSFIGYLEDEPLDPFQPVDLHVAGGGMERHTGYDASEGRYSLNPFSKTLLYRVSANKYERVFPDGSKEVYGQFIGTAGPKRKIFLTEIVDPHGNAVSLVYGDGTKPSKLTSIVDAVGQSTTIQYGATDPYQITSVTDPFGRVAAFTYTTGTVKYLNKITDVIGIESSFAYDSSGLINAMTTPYGTTRFTYGNADIHRWLTATDPMGETERAESNPRAFVSLAGDVPSHPGLNLIVGDLGGRSTFYWDKKAMREAPGDYTKAVTYAWMGLSYVTTTDVLHSEKTPLSNRVWYDYNGIFNGLGVAQIDINETTKSPTKIARVVETPSGTATQLYQIERDNLYQQPTLEIDPKDRYTRYTYAANDIDLVKVDNPITSKVFAEMIYNSQHQPTQIKDASGRTTSFTYNSYGQVTSVMNAKSETTDFHYDGNHRLDYIDGPISGTSDRTTFTYYASTSYTGEKGHRLGQLWKVTDGEGYELAYDYDKLERITEIKFPDNTTRQFVYNVGSAKRLEPQAEKDRLGRWTTFNYDANRRLVGVSDALGRVTQYDWCICGALSGITDPLGQTTTWMRDIEGRVTQKVYADSTYDTYEYQPKSGKLKKITDATGRAREYKYELDERIALVDHSGPGGITAADDVSFTYDSTYPRMTEMVTGSDTTAYIYRDYRAVSDAAANGSGMLWKIDGPWSNDVIEFGYDELGRVTSRSINSVSQTMIFDAAGRITDVTNALGSFTYTYVNGTNRVQSIAYPNGQDTLYDYHNNAGDQRLEEINNLNSSSGTISKFNYVYDVEGNITQWTRQADSSTPTRYDFRYDAVDQVLSATLKNTSTSAIVKQYLYSYDVAGNRTSETTKSGSSFDGVRQFNHNNVNELTSEGAGGAVLIKGHTNEPATVTVNGTPAKMVTTTNFEAKPSLTAGSSNAVSVVAQDYSSNSTTQNYSITLPAGTPQTLDYDDAGNLIEDGTRTYEWDTAGRLSAINYKGTSPAERSEFRYDGLDRRIEIIEKSGASSVSQRQYLWCGLSLCEERGNSGATINKRYLSQGVEIGGTDYYYNRDHLGSVRELIDGSSAVQARYDYDPYGNPTKISGSLDVDISYTGHFMHVSSGLLLAPYRAYDPESARWITRDPIEEQAGLNLYVYVFNGPINAWDPLGLQDWEPFSPGQWENNDTHLFPDVPGRYDMGAHGFDEGKGKIERITDGQGKFWTPKELYDEVKGDPEFKKSKSVRMYICQAGRGGKGSFASEFGRLSGKPVEAGQGDLKAAKSTGGKPEFSRPADMDFNILKPSTWRLGFGKY